MPPGIYQMDYIWPSSSIWSRADHRQTAGDSAQTLQRDVAMADLAQPFVEGSCAGSDVLPTDGVERGDCQFGAHSVGSRVKLGLR